MTKAAETKTVAGDSKQTEDVKGYLTVYAAKQLTMGLKEKTVKNRVNALKLLCRHGADLFDPLSVFKAIDNAKKIDRITGELKDEEWSDATKYQAADAYLKFCDLSKISIPEDVNLRKFRSTQKLPWIPQEKEIDQLIAGSSRKVASFLQLLKETGVRCGEAWRIEWTDIDVESGTLTINKPEKNGLPRQFKISTKLICMLNSLPKTSERIWGDSKLNYHRQNFTNQRKRIAAILQNPRLLRITFHTFRHFFATMEYHKTHGHILHVQERLGHRSILSTMLYTHLIHFERDEYIVKTASNLKEDKELLLAGFEFVTEREGTKIYRKRK